MPFVHSFDDVTPPARFDSVPWTRVRVEESATESGTFTEIAALAVANDPTPETPNPIDVTVATATLERAWFRFRFDTGASSATSPYTAPVFSPSSEDVATFASTSDITTRLDRTLTAGQQAQVALLLAAATTVISDAADKSDSWAATLNPVPQILRFVCIELVCRAMDNPEGLEAFSEQLGAHRTSKSYRKAAQGAGILLTKTEELLVRRAVHGTTTGSAAVQSSQVEEVHDLLYGS